MCNGRYSYTEIFYCEGGWGKTISKGIIYYPLCILFVFHFFICLSYNCQMNPFSNAWWELPNGTKSERNMKIKITENKVRGGAPAERVGMGPYNEAFRHVETSFVHGNFFVLNQNKTLCLVIKKEVNYC